MHEPGVARRERDGDSGRQQRPFAGREVDVGHGGEIGSGITGHCVVRQRRVRMHPANLDAQRITGRGGRGRAGHRAKGYPRPVIEPAAHRTAATGYQERLRTPWWWYPVGALVGVLLGAEFIFVLPDSLAWLPVVLSIVLGAVVVWRMSSGRVAVVGQELQAGDRTLPLDRIEQMYPLSYGELRRVVGRHGDPLAYNFVRSWVGPGVQLVLTEPPPPAPDAEWAPPPEPYWLVSTRHPDRLLAAIRAAG